MIRTSLLALAAMTTVAGTAHAQYETYDRSPAYGGAAATSPGATADYSVRDIQRALAEAGYQPGPVDGALGPSTRRAIVEFQQDIGLTVTGAPSAGLVQALERRGYLTADAGPQFASPQYGQQAYGQQQYGQQQYGQQAEVRTQPELVADVQAALRRQGYEVGGVTGSLDTDTRAAIRAFQREQGLPATGQPTPELLNLIETAGRAGPGTTTAEIQTEGDLVRQIEQRLANKGYDVGPINTEIEQKTAAAIRQYEAQRGFTPTGNISPQLLADLEATTVRAEQAAQAPATPEEAAGEMLRNLGERAFREFQSR